MDFVQGKNVVLFQKIGTTTYQPIGCAESVSFEFENEIIGKTDVNAGGFRKKRVRMSDCRASLSGVVKISNEHSILSVFYVLQNGISRSEIEYKIVFTAENKSDYTVTFSAVVSRISTTSSTTDMSSFDIELEGTGGIEQDPVSSPSDSAGEVTSDTWTITGGVQYIEDVRLLNKDIIEVCLEGTQHEQATGTPVYREFKYTPSIGGKGRIEFDPNLGNMDGNKVFVIWLY